MNTLVEPYQVCLGVLLSNDPYLIIVIINSIFDEGHSFWYLKWCHKPMIIIVNIIILHCTGLKGPGGFGYFISNSILPTIEIKRGQINNAVKETQTACSIPYNCHFGNCAISFNHNTNFAFDTFWYFFFYCSIETTNNY